MRLKFELSIILLVFLLNSDSFPSTFWARTA